MRSYHLHLAHTGPSHGSAVARKPTFRSSALFPVFHFPDFRTRIAFLGYWIVKRSIQEVHSVVTLRSREGAILCRTTDRITEAKAYRIEIEDLLTAAGLDARSEFTGSLEIEFYSSRDLVFAYPAVVVQYYNPEFGTIVHTAQRVFNDAEDRDANQAASVPEAGFNVYADDSREPFIAFVNGCDPVRDSRIAMTFRNSEQQTLDCAWDVPLLAPYETTVVYPDRRADLQRFLNGKPGTAKIRFDVSWTFPRILAGNMLRARNGASVTHTYYDNSQHATDESYWDRETPPGWYPASLMMPLSVAGDRYTNLNFYPIYSPAEVMFDAEFYGENGSLIGVEPNVYRTGPSQGGLRTLALKPIALRHGADPSRPLTVNLIARPAAGSRLPTRLKVGIDYGIGEQAMPCNICKTMDVCNPALENKKSSFHWGPVVADQLDAIVWIVNGSPRIHYERKAGVTLTLYREEDAAVLVSRFELPPGGIRELRLSDHPEWKAFFGGRIGWYTCVSDNPYVKTYYISESRSGIVGGDHDF